MANPANVGLCDITSWLFQADITAPYRFATLAASPTSIQTVILDARKIYYIYHNGENESGATDTKTIYLAISGNAIANATAGDGKLKLQSFSPPNVIPLGPGIQNLQYTCAVGGAPTFVILPGPRFYGNF